MDKILIRYFLDKKYYPALGYRRRHHVPRVGDKVMLENGLYKIKEVKWIDIIGNNDADYGRCTVDITLKLIYEL